MAEAEGGDEKKAAVVDDSKKVVHTYPLLRHADIADDTRGEMMDLVVTACEKYSSNNEAAAKMIKEELDKKFGPPFHVVVGEGFGFEITYAVKNLLHMFFGGTLGICIWKC